MSGEESQPQPPPRRQPGAVEETAARTAGFAASKVLQAKGVPAPVADAAGGVAGRLSARAVRWVAAAVGALIVLLALLVAGLAALLSGPPVETAETNERLSPLLSEQMLTMQLIGHAYEVPWPLLVALAYEQTQSGRYSPYDDIDRDPAGPLLESGPSVIARHRRGTLALTGQGLPAGTDHPVLAEAVTHLDKPYVWAGTGPHGFDCSGFTQRVFADVGVDLPRVAGAQAAAVPQVPLEQMQPGDILYFGPTSASNVARNEHIGIYYGDGQMIHAGRSASGVSNVNIIDLSARRAPTSAHRVPLDGAMSAAASVDDRPATTDAADTDGTEDTDDTADTDDSQPAAPQAGPDVDEDDRLDAADAAGVSIHPQVQPPIGEPGSVQPQGMMLLRPDAPNLDGADPQRTDEAAQVVAEALARNRDDLLDDAVLPLDPADPASLDAFWATAVNMLSDTIADPSDLLVDCAAVAEPSSSAEVGEAVAAVWRCMLTEEMTESGMAVLDGFEADGQPRIVTGRRAVDLLVAEALRVSYAWSAWDLDGAGEDPAEGVYGLAADRSQAAPTGTVPLGCRADDGLEARADTAAAWQRLCAAADRDAVELRAVAAADGTAAGQPCDGPACAGTTIRVAGDEQTTAWLTDTVACLDEDGAVRPNRSRCTDGQQPLSRAAAHQLIPDPQDASILTVAADTAVSAAAPACHGGIVFPDVGATVRGDGVLVAAACDPLENIAATASTFLTHHRPASAQLLTAVGGDDNADGGGDNAAVGGDNGGGGRPDDDAGALADLSATAQHQLLVGGWGAPGLREVAGGDEQTQAALARFGPFATHRTDGACRDTIGAQLARLTADRTAYADDRTVADALLRAPHARLPAAGSPQPDLAAAPAAPSGGPCPGGVRAPEWPDALIAEVRRWQAVQAGWGSDGSITGLSAVDTQTLTGVVGQIEQLRGDRRAPEMGVDAQLPRLSPARLAWPALPSDAPPARPELDIGARTVRLAVALGSGLSPQDPRIGDDAPTFGELAGAAGSALSPLQADPANRTGGPPSEGDLTALDCGTGGEGGLRLEDTAAQRWETMCAAAADAGVRLSVTAAFEPDVADPSSPLRRGRGLILEVGDPAAVDWLHGIVGCYDRSTRSVRRFPQTVSHRDYARWMGWRRMLPTDGDTPVPMCGRAVFDDDNGGGGDDDGGLAAGERIPEVPVKRLHEYGWFPSGCGSDPSDPSAVRCGGAGGSAPGLIEMGLAVNPDVGTVSAGRAGGGGGQEVVGVFDSEPGLPTVDAQPGSMEALIAGAFPPDEVQRAVAVANCESPGLDPSLTGPVNADGTRDHGLFQFNDGGTLQGMLRRTDRDPGDIQAAYDPVWAVEAARLLWEDRWWQPWVCAYHVGILSGLYASTPGPNGGSGPG